jgi:hypothetical protein
MQAFRRLLLTSFYCQFLQTRMKLDIYKGIWLLRCPNFFQSLRKCLGSLGLGSLDGTILSLADEGKSFNEISLFI